MCGAEVDELMELKTILIGVGLNKVADKWVWEIESKKIFFCKILLRLAYWCLCKYNNSDGRQYDIQVHEGLEMWCPNKGGSVGLEVAHLQTAY